MNRFREGYAAVRDCINGARRILISGHLSPDGDSLGSMLAMRRMLCNCGKCAFACGDTRQLGKPGFLAGCKELIPLRRLKREKFDLLILVDCGAPDRLPLEVRPFAEKIPAVCIDHHVTNDGSFGVAQIVDPAASSTCELVWRFAKWMEWPIDAETAEALWVGLVTDTGRFSYSSTKPGTLRAAGDLLKHGVRTSEIADIIFGRYSAKSIELKRIAWKSLHIWKNRKVAEVSLTRDDFRSVRGTKADAEDAVEIPRSVASNEIALFFYEIPDRTKETRCSIRTRSNWDATVLAKRFGGGGHVQAAGCTIQAPIAAARRMMRKAVQELIKSAGRKKTDA